MLFCGGTEMAVKYISESITKKPAADDKESPLGRWKGAGMGDYLCSLCWEVYSGGNEFKYCPNCGAKMK
jgi:hypothetical protein